MRFFCVLCGVPPWTLAAGRGYARSFVCSERPGRVVVFLDSPFFVFVLFYRLQMPVKGWARARTVFLESPFVFYCCFVAQRNDAFLVQQSYCCTVVEQYSSRVLYSALVKLLFLCTTVCIVQQAERLRTQCSSVLLTVRPVVVQTLRRVSRPWSFNCLSFR